MAIIFNIFQSGLNGGTKILTGDSVVPKIENGNFQGFVVVRSCFIDSILNENGLEIITNVILNNQITNITNINLVRGDIVKPASTENHFTRVTIRPFSNSSQIVLYNKK